MEFGRGIADGAVMAAVSIADGVAVDLGSALSGLDEHNIAGVARAVLHAAGHRDLRAAVEGECW